MPGYPRRPLPLGNTDSATLPAPSGGVNAVDPPTVMPASDAISAFNVIGSKLGVRVRLGYEEWVTGLPSDVLTEMPFSGNAATGADDKLFAACSEGIFDVSASTDSPVVDFAFAITSGEAGRGMSFVASSTGARFLVYCDEENGLHIYPAGGPWATVPNETTQLWEPNTEYEPGNRVISGGNVYECDTAGVSSSSGGPTGIAADIVDGTTRWDFIEAQTPNAIGPSLADQNLGYSGDPANFVFGTVWGSRIWFVEKNSTRAWYGDIQALYGTYTSFDFGTRMRHGGPLKALYTWSYDAGAGLESLLVGLSEAGDVVIYGGSDPSSPETFSLRGSWFAGGFPAGRTIATEDAGELLVMTKLGILPASRLITGASIEEANIYITRKISPIIAQLVDSKGDIPGWALHIHPTDNALLALIPEEGEPTTQWAYSYLTKGWFPCADLPMLSAAVWNGQLFFGTTDGRVCVNQGNLDNVLLSDPNVSSPISWGVLHAYQTLGTARLKRVHMVRPVLLSDSPDSLVTAGARYDFDLTPLNAPSGSAATSGAALWDTAIWDVDLWGGDSFPTARLLGATGLGRAVSVAVRGTSSTETILASTDVMFDVGGLL